MTTGVPAARTTAAGPRHEREPWRPGWLAMRLVLAGVWLAAVVRMYALRPAATSTEAAVLGGPAQPGWWALTLAGAWLLTVMLVVGGPRPWRATRWAWLWLSAPPLGALAFLLLSGPTPGLALRPTVHRLNGWWALLLSWVLAGVLLPPWWPYWAD